MRDRRKGILASVAVVLVMGRTAGLALASGREPAARPVADSRLLSPFTGAPVTVLGPVLAVKIDNVTQARPQTGLSSYPAT
jgi:hypothetical protein